MLRVDGRSVTAASAVFRSSLAEVRMADLLAEVDVPIIRARSIFRLKTRGDPARGHTPAAARLSVLRLVVPKLRTMSLRFLLTNVSLLHYNSSTLLAMTVNALWVLSVSIVRCVIQLWGW